MLAIVVGTGYRKTKIYKKLLNTFIRAKNLSKILTARTKVSVQDPKKLVKLLKSSTLAFLNLGHKVLSFCNENQEPKFIIFLELNG